MTTSLHWFDILLVIASVILVLGVGLSLAQQQWGLVSLTTQTLLIDSYPIDLRWSDVVLCALTYGVVAFAVIHLTVRGALRKAD